MKKFTQKVIDEQLIEELENYNQLMKGFALGINDELKDLLIQEKDISKEIKKKKNILKEIDRIMELEKGKNKAISNFLNEYSKKKS